MAERERRPASKQTGRKSAGKTTPRKGTTKKSSPAKQSTARKTSARKSSARTSPAAKTAKTAKTASASSDSSRRSKQSSAARVATGAARQLLELTGKEPEGVVSISKDGDSWMVEVEVLELRRIPNTTDVLASYEVTVDTDGELIGYRRLRRYTRGSAGEE